MLARDLDVISPGEYPHWERQAEGRSELSRWPGLAVVITYCYQPVCGAERTTATPSCNNYSSDMRVRIGNAERYVYPAIVATCCSQEECEDDWQDVLLNPLLIIEVL